jgi:hypothetical protein
MPLFRELFFLRMTIWLSGLKRWLVLGGVAVGHQFETQSDLELFSAKILIDTHMKFFLI